MVHADRGAHGESRGALPPFLTLALGISSIWPFLFYSFIINRRLEVKCLSGFCELLQQTNQMPELCGVPEYFHVLLGRFGN